MKTQLQKQYSCSTAASSTLWYFSKSLLAISVVRSSTICRQTGRCVG